MITLYDYQQKTIDMLRSNIAKKIYNNVIQLPTGAGKTVIALYVIKNAATKNNNTLFLADRIDIINQTDKIVRDNHAHENVIIITPQSLESKLKSKITKENMKAHYDILNKDVVNYLVSNNIKIVFIDECHVRYKMNEKIIEACKSLNIFVIGLSATPYANYLTKYFHDEIIIPITMHQLVKNGKLIMPQFHVAKNSIKFEGVEYIKGNEYDYTKTEKELININKEVVIAIKYILKQTKRRMIVFGTTIRHCEELCKELTKNGINSVMYTGKTSEKNRKLYVEQMKSGEIDCLVSVAALNKGFDLPIVDCIIDCKPILNSINSFIQGIGRATRITEGKTDAMYIDFVGNYNKFNIKKNLIYDGLIKTLSHGSIINETKDKVIKCRHCNRELPAKVKICLYEDCGMEQGIICECCTSIILKYPCKFCEYEYVEGKSLKEKLQKDYKEIMLVEGKQVNVYNYIYAQIKFYALQKVQLPPHKKVWYVNMLYTRITGLKPEWKYEDIRPAVLNRHFKIFLFKHLKEIAKELKKKEELQKFTDRLNESKKDIIMKGDEFDK